MGIIFCSFRIAKFLIFRQRLLNSIGRDMSVSESIDHEKPKRLPHLRCKQRPGLQLRQVDLDVIPVFVGVNRNVTRQARLEFFGQVAAYRIVRRNRRLNLFLPTGEVNRIIGVHPWLMDGAIFS